MKRILHFFLFFFLLLPFGLPLRSQYAGKPFIINFTKDVYNGESQNWSVDRTDEGMVYIGNNKGLLAFDGSNWKIFSMPEQMLVRSVAVDKSGKVYVGAYEEFGYFSYDENGEFIYNSLTEHIEPGFFHNDEIWRIIIMGEKVYFQSFSSIYIFENGELSRIDPQGTIVLLMKARNRIFIHRVNDGLFELVDDSLVFVAGSGMLAGDEVKMILPRESGGFILGASHGGLFILKEGELKEWDISMAKQIAESEINNGLLLENHIIIGTIVGGIYILDLEGDIIEHLSTSNFLQNNTVLSLCRAGPDEFWAGLDRGLDYISLNNSLDIYLRPSGSTSTVYDAIFYDSALFLATNQGVFKYRFDKMIGFYDPVLLNGSQGQVWDLCLIDNEVFCGHTNGTYKIENDQLKLISSVNGGFDLKEVNWGNSSYLLQSTYSVFTVYKPGKRGWEFSNSINGFVEPIPHFELDHLGNIWANHTNRGIYRLRPDNSLNNFDEVRYFGKEDGFHTDRKIQVAKVENRIVFCTRKLIYTYDDLVQKIIPYDFLNNGLGEFLESDRIVAVGRNLYWCLMDNRIALFEIFSGSIEKKFDYDFSSSGAWLSSNFPQIALLSDSIHFICLDNGFAVYDSRKDFYRADSVKTIIRKVEYGNEKSVKASIILPGTKEYQFGFTNRNISIEFSADKVAASRFFSYKLEGLDENWKPWSLDSRVSFLRLPAGDYVFKVKARTINGHESSESKFSFKIRKPWYFSQIAIIVYVALIITLLVFMRLTFMKRLALQSEKLQKEDREKRQRDRILAEQSLVKLRNDKLRSELSHKSIQLANYTMTLLRKNELLIKLKDEITKQKEELGGRYPNYYYDKIVRLVDSNISTEDDWKVFEMHFDQAHENFFRRLLDKYPELTPSDMKLCAYLRLNLTTKEIAPLLNISVRGVEIRRYRLRKRLNLEKEDNLIEFLLSF